MRKYLVLFTFLIAGCSSSTKENQATNELANIQLTDLNGEPVKLEDIKGKVIFLNFWATWCRPCLEEMPGIMRLRDQLPSDEVVFYFASDESAERIEEFLDRRSFTGNFVRVENQDALGIQALPTTFIFDKDGHLVYSEVGYKNWESPAERELITRHLSHDK